jgi:hypothetical protein
VFYNEYSSAAPTRKLKDRHVGVANGLRNGGSRTKSQQNISFTENSVMKTPITGHSRGVTITSYMEVSPPPTTFAEFSILWSETDLHYLCDIHAQGGQFSQVQTCNTHLGGDLNQPPRRTSPACTHLFITRQRGRFACDSQLMRLPREAPGIWYSGLTRS